MLTEEVMCQTQIVSSKDLYPTFSYPLADIQRALSHTHGGREVAHDAEHLREISADPTELPIAPSTLGESSRHLERVEEARDLAQGEQWASELDAQLNFQLGPIWCLRKASECC